MQNSLKLLSFGVPKGWNQISGYASVVGQRQHFLNNKCRKIVFWNLRFSVRNLGDFEQQG